MKKFSVLAAIFFFLYTFSIPVFVSAKEISADIVDAQTELMAVDIDKYLESLPQKKSYKSKQRPLMIQGAMNIEIEKFVRTLKNPTTYRFSNYLYIAGTYKNYPVVIVRTEQGMANAAASTVIGIKEFNPIAVINQGTAGGHIPALYNNDIVIGDKSINVSAYKTEFLPAGAGTDMTKQNMRGTYAYDAAKKTFTLNTEYYSDTKLLRIAESVADSHKEFKTMTGTISSADSWNELVDYMTFLHEKYGSVCEEMENNAAASICKSNGVPFIGIRVISDNATNGEKWQPSTAETCQNFVLLVAEKFIDTLPKK